MKWLAYIVTALVSFAAGWRWRSLTKRRPRPPVP